MSMSLRKLEAQGAKKTKRKHGVYAFLASGELPSGRAWKRTQREVAGIRLQLIEQYGGEKIKPSVLALIDSAVEGLMIQRLAGLYIKRAGILRGDSLAKGNLELHAILSGQFISYANLVRLNLESAARLAGQKEAPDAVPTIAEIIAEHDREEAAKAHDPAQGRAALAQDGRSHAGPGLDEAQDPGESGENGEDAGKEASRIAQERRPQADEASESGETT